MLDTSAGAPFTDTSEVVVGADSMLLVVLCFSSGAQAAKVADSAGVSSTLCCRSHDTRQAGVRLGLGCDNCSGSDGQSVFQAIKMFCLITAASEPQPGPGLAHEVLRYATIGNACTASLASRLGAIRPGSVLM
jgi:hypothetical protein